MKTTSKFRLFKRDDDGRQMDPTTAGFKDRPYYFRFTHRGIAYCRCLETNDAAEAQRWAKAKHGEIISAVTDGALKRLDATKLRAAQSVPLDELYAAYRSGPAEASVSTRNLNVNALKQIAGTATHVRDLTPALARQWFEATQLAVLNLADQELAASLKRSANSRWAQARSLFTERCLAFYQDRDLVTAAGAGSLEAFVKAGNAACFNRIPKQNYNPPSEEIIRATLASWEVLDDRDLFLAIGHELAFGLRLSEMAQARWSWHTTRNDYPVLDGRAQVKNGSGLIQVRALDPFYSIMKHGATIKGWWPAATDPDALIITGTDTYRTDGLFRAISDWLRKLGWATMKTNHALRAYAGSQVAMRYGIYEAQMFLRHSTVKVTEQNYSHFVSKFKPSDASQIPARWCVLRNLASTAVDATLDASHKYPLNSARLLATGREISADRN